MHGLHRQGAPLSRTITLAGFLLVAYGLVFAHGDWVRGLCSVIGVTCVLAGIFFGDPTGRALALYRLFRLEREKLWHLAVATCALVFGFLAHIVEVDRWLLGLVVLALLYAEWWLLAHDYGNLTSPKEDHLVEQAAFGELSEVLKRGDTEFADVFHYYEEMKVDPISGARVEGVVRSVDIDRWLQCEQPQIEVIPPTQDESGGGFEKALLNSHKTTHGAAFELFLVRQRDNGNQKRTNDAKIALRTDMAHRPTKISIARTSYFTSFVTNDVSTQRLMLRRKGLTSLYEDFRSLFPLRGDAPAKVLDIAESDLSNHLGASTVAVIQQQSDDRCFMVFPIQSGKAARSGGLYAPTGSGSLDWHDYEQCRANGNNDLLSIIRYGVQRELCEEQSLFRRFGRPADRLKRAIREKSIATFVLGYYRWMSVGGLPQFCCLSTMKVASLTSLRPCRTELQGKGENDELPQNPYAVASLKDLDTICKRMLETHARKMSVPLIVNLRLIRSTLAGEYGDLARANFTNFLAANVPTVQWG